MESELIRRKHLLGIVLCLTILVVIIFCGCDPRSGQYPFQKSEKWLSEEPMISLCYAQNDDRTWTFLEELHWNDEVITIEIAMQSNHYCVYPVESKKYDDRLFEGTWKYRRGNLILIVEEDFIFDNQYPEIVFVPVVQK